MRPEQTKCVQVIPNDAQRASTVKNGFNGGVAPKNKNKAQQESGVGSKK